MPYGTRKVRGKNCYKVYNKDNKKVFAKCTTQKKAISQMRLLRAIQYNKNFVPGLIRTGKTKRKTMKKIK
jgi:hypothetical protein